MAKDRGEGATPPSLNSPPLMVACIASSSFGRNDDVDGDFESANLNLEPRTSESRMRSVGGKKEERIWKKRREGKVRALLS